VTDLLARSNRVRLDLVAAVGAAEQGASQAQAEVPAVQRVVDARRAMLEQVSSWQVPPEAASANTLLAKSFQDSLSDDVIYQQFVSDLAAGDRAAAGNDLDTLSAQRQATHAHKAEFLREFNQLLTKTGRTPLPPDFVF
jgi:hypothetical protein